jgi:hypothetical protein
MGRTWRHSSSSSSSSRSGSVNNVWCWTCIIGWYKGAAAALQPYELRQTTPSPTPPHPSASPYLNPVAQRCDVLLASQRLTQPEALL